jgi:ferritin-like metal-binding protein YciE
MFEKLDNPRELFTYKLGSALEMEQTVLKSLDDQQGEAQEAHIKQLLSHHADETRQQIRNIEQAFEAIGEEADDKPCLPAEALDKEAKLEIRKADDRFVDTIILSAARETEHHEIAVYETLITHAEALGQPAVATLLRQNLEQEQHTLDEVKRAAQDVVPRAMATAA